MKTQRYVEKVDIRYTANGCGNKEDERFIQRVSQLPLVALTLSRMTEVYQATKLRNALLALALEKGEDVATLSWILASQYAVRTGLQRPRTSSNECIY